MSGTAIETLSPENQISPLQQPSSSGAVGYHIIDRNHQPHQGSSLLEPKWCASMRRALSYDSIYPHPSNSTPPAPAPSPMIESSCDVAKNESLVMEPKSQENECIFLNKSTSVEEINQEIEKLLLKGVRDNWIPIDPDRSLNREVPEGHRAPIAKLLSSSRKRNISTQTPSSISSSDRETNSGIESDSDESISSSSRQQNGSQSTPSPVHLITNGGDVPDFATKK